MRPVLESAIERAACDKILHQLGVPNIKLVKKSGWPDRMFTVPGGRPFLVEFKRPGEDPRVLQVHIHDMLRGLGYDVEVHDNVDDVFNAIRSRLEATQRAKARDEVHPRARVRRPRS